jgi:hypothetical protein
MEVIFESCTRFWLRDADTQDTVAELFIDKTSNTFDVRGPEDLGLNTVRKAIQRYISKHHLLCDVAPVTKVVMFRAKYTEK